MSDPQIEARLRPLKEAIAKDSSAFASALLDVLKSVDPSEWDKTKIELERLIGEYATSTGQGAQNFSVPLNVATAAHPPKQGAPNPRVSAQAPQALAPEQHIKNKLLEGGVVTLEDGFRPLLENANKDTLAAVKIELEAIRDFIAFSREFRRAVDTEKHANARRPSDAQLQAHGIARPRVRFVFPENTGYFENYYTHDATEHAAHHNHVSASNMRVNVGLALGGLRGGAGYGQRKQESTSTARASKEEAVFVTSSFYLPKMEFSVHVEEGAPASLGFVKAVERALNASHRPEQQGVALLGVLKRYGHFFPQRVLVGGKIYSTEEKTLAAARDARQAASDFAMKFNLSVAYAASPAKSGSGDVGYGSSESRTDSEQRRGMHERQSVVFNAIGGNGAYVGNIREWLASLEHYRQWAVVKRSGLRPTINLLPHDLQVRVKAALRTHAASKTEEELIREGAHFLFIDGYYPIAGKYAKKMYYRIEHLGTGRTLAPAVNANEELTDRALVKAVKDDTRRLRQLWRITTDGGLVNAERSDGGKHSYALTVGPGGVCSITNRSSETLPNQRWAPTPTGLIHGPDGRCLAIREANKEIVELALDTWGPEGAQAFDPNDKKWTKLGKDRIKGDEKLHPNNYLENGNYALVFQEDGNLVLHEKKSSKYEAQWVSGTGKKGTQTTELHLQLDGHVGIYFRDGTSRWSEKYAARHGYTSTGEDIELVMSKAWFFSKTGIEDEKAKRDREAGEKYELRLDTDGGIKVYYDNSYFEDIRETFDSSRPTGGPIEATDYFLRLWRLVPVPEPELWVQGWNIKGAGVQAPATLTTNDGLVSSNGKYVFVLESKGARLLDWDSDDSQIRETPVKWGAENTTKIEIKTNGQLLVNGGGNQGHDSKKRGKEATTPSYELRLDDDGALRIYAPGGKVFDQVTDPLEVTWVVSA